MKALVLEQYNNFVYKEVPKPQIEPDDVLIKIKACAICGSDIHGMDGSTGRRIPPVIMGHEASGVIEEIGSNVKTYKKGDRVTFDSTVYCGQCYFCKRGDINLCDNRRVLGVSCDEYKKDGTFAEYVAVPQQILYPIPESVTFEQASMVEPLSIAMHAVRNTQLFINDNAVVVGAGMIGLLIIQLLKKAGCGKIIAVDIEQRKLDVAMEVGANIVLNSNDTDVAKEVFKITRNRGADIAFEAVGISPAVNTALHSLRKGGSLTLVGNLSSSIEFPLQAAVTREITINGSCGSAGEYEACLDMIVSGDVDIDRFISSVVPLEQGNEWFKRLYNAEPGLMKVILVP